jgi:hypothetical protein
MRRIPNQLLEQILFTTGMDPGYFQLSLSLSLSLSLNHKKAKLEVYIPPPPRCPNECSS